MNGNFLAEKLPNIIHTHTRTKKEENLKIYLKIYGDIQCSNACVLIGFLNTQP